MRSPFKFLDAYTKDDKDIFFGRDNEIEELYQKVFGNKLLLVCGVSGTGKTSLINCGLANKFEESDWLPINIRRGIDITSSLKAGISKVALTPVKENQSIVKQLQSLYLDHFKPIYLIFDQFEEVFIFGNREERKEFISEVKKIVESDVQCRLLFVMREEYLAGAIEFEREIPTFLTNRIRIEKMTWHNAKQVIEAPCKVYGIEVEEGLTDNILGKLSPESIEVELTYLQVLLDKMFRLSIEKDKEKPTFSNNLLKEVGDVSDLLGSFLEEQINQLEDPETGLIILKSFVSVKGTKRQVTNEDINEFASILGKEISKLELKNLIQKFINLRILRDKDESGRYELRHDCLATKIYEKITLYEKELLEVKDFLDSAFQNFEKRNIYLSEADLKYIAPYEDKLFLNKKIEHFIIDSKKFLARTRRRRRNITITAVIVLFIIMGGFTIWALNEKNKAEDNYRISQARNFNLIAEKIVDKNPTIALRLAEYAWELDENESIKQSIYKIYSENNFYKIIANHENYIYSVAFSPDGKTILTGSYDKTARLWDLSGNLIQVFKGHEDGVRSVAFSPDGKIILTGSWDNTARLWDLSGNLIQVFKGHEEGVISVAFSPDGKNILTGSDDKTVRLWVIKTPLEQFQEKNNYEKLSISQKLEYEILKYQDILKLENPEDLYEGAQYYFDQSNGILGKTQKLECLFKAKNLYNKILSIEPRINYFFELADVFNKINDIEHDTVRLISGLNYIHEKLLSISGEEEQLEVLWYYYGKCININELIIRCEFPQKMLEVCESLLKSYPDDSLMRNEIVWNCNYLSWNLLLEKEFNIALRSAQLAKQADESYEYTYTILPLAYLFNNQYDKAESIYNEWKDKPYGRKTFREYFIFSLNVLESKGLTHPDFEKVRELLKE